ncbi:Oxidative stress-induced growth inhibitor 2 [Entomortierella chlamydospora]|uniref:Oxidative stress-induced growth inhibitor 2 n=1 Tax=Entomortierella chlamydospora TaxID=101097 RepID=A0A9P6MYB3_9FUNG|nr:Oxidative stress-induced growth inhibitor 2 [Entomortierella chlamydospora]
MFDSLAHPLLDTQRGEYPSFLEWKRPNYLYNRNLGDIDRVVNSLPPAPNSDPSKTLNSSATKSTARPHIVLGRGDVGGIWADLDKDFNQTLSYQEHMELPLYSFAEFLHDHPEHGEILERPLRSTVSAYYKSYIQKIGIQSNFSNYTTVTGIYHLKDLENHCCCSLDPKLRGKDKHRVFYGIAKTATGKACITCAPFRYAVMGYVEIPLGNTAGSNGSNDLQSGKKRTKFLIRSKTVVLATGTFDQPKKLVAVSVHPCSPPCSPMPLIQETFHDTRQLEEWMARHSSPTIANTKPSSAPEASPPLSPSSTSPPTSLTSPTLQDALPIVIVGTGLSAADAILLIQEKQPWRRVIHIFRHYTASEPSPLKRCHRDVYPEYASIWVKMKKSATLKNSVQAYPHQSRNKDGSGNGSSCSSTAESSGYCSIFGGKSREACEQCQGLKASQHDELSPLCSGCAYKGLPDAAISSWDPKSGEIVIILSHGVVIKERVAAVGVFIGKQVNMGFLKEKDVEAQESKRCERDTTCVVEEAQDEGEETGDEEEAEEVDESQILTLLRPLVSDMYNFRIIPTGIPMSEVEPSAIASASTPTIAKTSTGMILPAYPVKPKKCTRLPCYPIRHPSTTIPAPSTSLLPNESEESDDIAHSDDNRHGVDCLLLSCGLKQGSATTTLDTGSGGCSEEGSAAVTATTAFSRKSGLDIVTTPMSSASAVSSAMSVLLPTSLTSSCSPSPSSPSSSASSPTSLLVPQGTAAAGAMNDDGTEEPCCNSKQQQQHDDLCHDEEVKEEKYVEPLMDQSIYAAGAITGSKFVRYVLGNGVAIVADILKSEK